MCYFCVVVEGMYTCKTGNFGNKHLCLCLCCCRGYVHMYDWVFWKTIVCVCVCVVLEGM